MSDTQQGPDWWQASDGKWYPPEAKLPPPPANFQTQQPPGTQRSGCATAGIIVGVIFLVLIVLSFLSILAITFLGRSTGDKLSRLGGEVESGGAALVVR